MTQVACIGEALLHQGVLHNVLDPPKQKPARALDLDQNLTVMLNTTIVRTIQDIGVWVDTCDATYCQFHRWFNYMVTNDISLRQSKQVNGRLFLEIEAWQGRRWGRSTNTMSKGDVWSRCIFVHHSVQINVPNARHDSENRRKNGKSGSRFLLGPQKKSEKKSCGSYACARCVDYEWLKCGRVVRAWGRNMVTGGSEGVLQGLDNEWGSRVNGNLRHFRNRKKRPGTRAQCELCNRESVKQYLNHMRMYHLLITNRSVCAPFLTQVNTSSRLRSRYLCPVLHARKIFLSPYCTHNAIHTVPLVSNMNTTEKKKCYTLS